MDSMKLRNASKLAKLTNSHTPKKTEIKLSDDEEKTISDLKKLYLETIQLDVDLQREIYNMEKSFEHKHNEIFEKRNKILDGIRKRAYGDGKKQPNLMNFWLKVLKASYTEFISKKDEKILAHLTDIRAHLFNDPVVKFVIEFQFDANEYFANRLLTKTYFLNCLPDTEDPLSYDGAEIYKCEGCKIDWKENNKEKDKKAFSSFFDFFSPPALPEDPEEASYYDINAILQNDFELGFYLKERVIPKAIMFFTGEIADCQSTDEDTDEDSDEDADEEDDDADEEADEISAN